ncbi:Bax inhibitor-1/YccA family protein [Endozoicomonas sp. G2_2]|uniref:Bax inhibitor-1/YccA family protein n=1 Tax=Pseudomonadota TaxID=1224 RepID=UPI000C37C5D6|nr:MULTISPECIES: Bax inhibitor-1/YccA family protein [Pseudomonadota]MAS09159.1 BAX inhibitor protein [Salinisphaera sp.]MBO9468924.1 Bax inhibitor-1/YccA family protein [Endozoicomonas sp. G2_2]|tara:strand:- start:1509 stop:2180 length:672 start_codon:yes stop_codon:yes gene_type:complete
MNAERTVQSSRAQTALATNSVLRNTYMLLSLTLLFSAAVAGTAMALNAPHPGLIITLVGYFGLLFAVEKTKNSAMGLVSVFALTGFMGYTIGPILNMYLNAFSNGGEIVMLALGGTGTIFMGMSAYALASGKRFNQWAGMLFMGILVAFVMSIVAVIFSIPALSMAVSALFVLLMSGLIVYQTGEIVHGGETNYITATVTLFVTIYNLFLSLLQLLGVFMGEE